LGLSYPPIFEKTIPPKITPETGPVIAATEKKMVAFDLVTPRIATQKSVIQN
jgi:hypothetical protein